MGSDLERIGFFLRRTRRSCQDEFKALHAVPDPVGMMTKIARYHRQCAEGNEGREGRDAGYRPFFESRKPGNPEKDEHSAERNAQQAVPGF